MEKDLTNQRILMQQYETFVDYHLKEAISLIERKQIGKITAEYRLAMKKRNVDLGLNLFSVISPNYHRENFHSDILRIFLYPEGEHKEGNAYLNAFLVYLNSIGANLTPSDYTNVEVRREEGKLDLAILDRSSKKAIIIENKINGARDMIRQLPRYLQQVTEWGFCCTKIVYLVLNKKKDPDTFEWTEKEKKEVKKRLVIIAAYDETDHDLYNGWLNTAERIASNVDVKFVVKQYRDIIKKLGGNVMNKLILEKFYAEMLTGETFKVALSIETMIQDLIQYRQDRIIEHYKSHPQPFESVGPYKEYAVIFWRCMIGASDFSIDLVVRKEDYSFEFWDRNYTGQEGNPAQRLLIEMQEDGFTLGGIRMKKVFKFPEEEDTLYQYIDTFKEKLAKIAQ